MAITFSDSITGQPTSTSAPVIPSFSPEIARDPMDDVHPLLRPSIEEDKKEAEALRAWKLDTRKKGDAAILDFDSFQPGEKDEVKKRRIIRGVLESEFDINPENVDQYRMARRQAARKIFGKDIGDSDESFFGALQERATKTKETIDFYGKLDRQATLSALLGGGQIEMAFGKEAENDPVFKREKARAIQRWKDSKEAVTEQYGDMIPMLRSTFRRMQTGDEWLSEASRVAKELDEDEKTKFLVALRDLATTYPTEEIENGFKRLGLNLKKSGRGVSGAVDAAIVGGGDLVREGGTWHFAELFGSNEAVAEAKSQQWRDEQWVKAFRKENDFVADVRRIFEEDYDPIRPLAEEGSKLRAVEEGVYAIPGAVTTTAMAFVPGAGLPMTYGTIREFERQKYRGRLLENGVSRDEAAAISDRLSTISAAPQVLLEKLQANIAVGKLPVLNKIFGKLDDVVASKAVRGLGRFTAASTSETGIELTQELTSELVQDLARNFQEEIPDVEWQNGKDGYFDGYFNKTITTFVAVAPLSIIPTMKGLSVEKRAEAVKLTSPLVRKAWGINETDSAAIDAAETPGQQVRAMEQALINRDPQAEGAKEATAELEAQMQKQKEAQKELENMGAIPGVRTSQEQDGFEVYEAETGDTIALVETSQEAAEAVFDSIGMRERASQEHVDALVAKLEAGRIVTDETGVTQEIEDTKLLTTQEAGILFEGADERIAREQELLEISEGGSGEVAKAVMKNDVILGAALPAGVNGRIEAVTKLYRASSIFTLVHEKAHQVRRTLIERGELGHDEQVSFFRSLNKVLAGRSTKDGQSLEFGGFDADVVDETALDEGWAQFAEIMLLKSQNGKKSRLRELLNKNLSAMVRSRVPGASKFASFIRSMRAFFGLNLSRAAALDRAERSGEIDSAEMERFRAMVMGETLQDQYESDVVETFEETFVPTDDVPFSIGSSQDAAYLSAVESGDMEAAQSMVDEAARAAGYDSPKVMHGTAAQFDIFDLGKGGSATNAQSAEIAFFFTDDQRTAQAYASYAAMDVPVNDLLKKADEAADRDDWDTHDELQREAEALAEYKASFQRKTDNARIVTAYLKGNFAEFDAEGETPQGISVKGDLDSGLSGRIRDAASQGKDGVIFRNLDDAVGLHDVVADHYAVLNPNQIKSAEPVTRDESGDVIPLSKRFNEKDDRISFSLGNSAMADSIIGDVTARVRDPEARADILENIILNVDQLKRDADKLIFGGTVTQKAIVEPRKMKSLRKEAAMRQALRYDELETELLQKEGAALAQGDAMTLKDMPIHGFIARPGSGLAGGAIESRSAFVKRTGRSPGAEYEGSEGMVSGLVFGGMRSPDQMATELHREGLISEDSPALMWDLLASERVSVKNNQEDFKKALKRLAEVKKQAKTEADEWLSERVEEQERDHNPMARLRRSLAMLDAILMALPVELRGKVGGFVQLAKLNSQEKRLEFLKGRIEKLDKVVEDWVKSEHRKQIDKLFDRARPKKTGKGVPKSKIAADFADRAMAIERMSRMTADEVAGRMDEIQDAMAEATDQAETDALTGDLVELLSFGNIDGMNAQALDSFFRNLNSVVETGKMLKDFADEKFKIEADGIKEIVNHDVTGGGGRMLESESKRRAKEKGKLELLSKFHRENVSFEWLMNNLSRENKAVGTLQSETHKKLSTMVHEATHSEKRENMAVQTRYQDFLSSVFGGLKGLKLTGEISKFMEEVEQTGVIRIDYAGKGAFSKKTARASNIEAVINGDTDLETLGLNAEEWKSAKARYDEIVAKSKNGKVKGSRVVEYQSPNVGTPDNLTLSQSQAINLTMLFRQEGLKDSMIHEGYTEEAMQQMEDFLTPEAIAIRDWLTQEYADNYHTINNVFKEANGVSLPQTEFYSPARRLADGKVDDLSIDSRGGSAMSTNPNFTISRTKNFAEVDQTADALSIYMQHMIQTNHYVAWAQPTKMLRTVFSDKGVKKNINDYAGDSLLGVISERIEWMADGGNRKAKHIGWMDRLRAAHTYSSLAFNWGVAIKQLTSLPAYAFDMSFKDFGKYAAKFMAHPVKNIKEMASTDYVKTRFKEGYERDVIDGLRREGGIFMKGLQAGMLFGKAGDIVPVMIGGWMARQRSYDNAIADGMSEAEARKKSTIDFEMITDRAQQAGDMKDFSSFQGGGSLFKLFTMYKTSPRQYYANVYESFLDAKAGKKGASKELGRRLMIGQIILPLTFQFASDVLRSPFDGDDEDFEAENYVRAMLLGPLNGLFIAGDFAEVITSGITDAAVWAEKVPIFDGATKMTYGFKDFWRGDWADGLDDVARGIGKTTPNPLTFYDIIRKELKRFGVG